MKPSFVAATVVCLWGGAVAVGIQNEARNAKLVVGMEAAMAKRQEDAERNTSPPLVTRVGGQGLRTRVRPA
ncbi:hypothetical protein RJ55_06410 [Drechmeria coniospora]|nr:hypothetical protein RJ55_06410 [Drechmeria coniospora]